MKCLLHVPCVCVCVYRGTLAVWRSVVMTRCRITLARSWRWRSCSTAPPNTCVTLSGRSRSSNRYSTRTSSSTKECVTLQVRLTRTRAHTHTFTISSDSSYYYYSDIIFRHDVLVEKVVIKHLLDFFIYIFILLYIYKSFIPFVLFFF